MAYFKTCKLCGASLDPGEKCTCEEERKEAEEQAIIKKQVNTFLLIRGFGNGSIKRKKRRTN